MKYLDKYPECIGCPVSKYCGTMVSSIRLCNSYHGDWLKSLKPQNRWKPSEEQLNALKQCIGGYYSEEADKKLELLYDDLKKL